MTARREIRLISPEDIEAYEYARRVAQDAGTTIGAVMANAVRAQQRDDERIRRRAQLAQQQDDAHRRARRGM